jgi:hypothetical protein
MHLLTYGVKKISLSPLKTLKDDEQKGLDQQLVIHVSPTEVEQHTVKYEITESNQQKYFNFQLEQQLKEVFLYDFNDPIAKFLESMSNINVKIFLSDENWFYHLFKSHFLLAMHSIIFQVKIKNRFSKSVSDMASLEA